MRNAAIVVDVFFFFPLRKSDGTHTFGHPDRHEMDEAYAQRFRDRIDPKYTRKRFIQSNRNP